MDITNLDVVLAKIKKHFNYQSLHLEKIGGTDEYLLTICIKNSTTEQVLNDLSNFDLNWWIDNSSLMNNKLIIDVCLIN